MNKNRSLFQGLFLRIHYKTSLAIVSVFLGVLTLSGYYFFGQNIVNEADEQQRIARIQMRDDESRPAENSISPTITQSGSNNTDKKISGIGGSGAPEPSISLAPSVTPSISPTKSNTPTASPSATPTIVRSLNPSKFVMGDANAEKTIIAYYDFECSACANFVNEKLQSIKSSYIDSGQYKVIFKNFPLLSHPNSPIAHNAAMCASLDGDFWTYHNAVFTNHSEWAGKNSPQMKEYLKSYYTGPENTKKSFNDCVDGNVYANYVDEDKKAGKALGITKAPSFMVNDEILEGSVELEEYLQSVQSE